MTMIILSIKWIQVKYKIINKMVEKIIGRLISLPRTEYLASLFTPADVESSREFIRAGSAQFNDAAMKNKLRRAKRRLKNEGVAYFNGHKSEQLS